MMQFERRFGSPASPKMRPFLWQRFSSSRPAMKVKVRLPREGQAKVARDQR